MAISPSVAGFRAYFGTIFQNPESYPDAFIQAHLDDCMIEVHQCVFGKYYTRALYYLTAHYVMTYKEIEVKAALAPAGSTAVSAAKGVIESTSVGDLSLTKSMQEYNKTSDDKFLASTIFGQEFIRLRNKMTKGPLLSRDLPTGGFICGGQCS